MTEKGQAMALRGLHLKWEPTRRNGDGAAVAPPVWIEGDEMSATPAHTETPARGRLRRLIRYILTGTLVGFVGLSILGSGVAFADPSPAPAPSLGVMPNPVPGALPAPTLTVPAPTPTAPGAPTPPPVTFRPTPVNPSPAPLFITTPTPAPPKATPAPASSDKFTPLNWNTTTSATDSAADGLAPLYGNLLWSAFAAGVAGLLICGGRLAHAHRNGEAAHVAKGIGMVLVAVVLASAAGAIVTTPGLL